VAGGLEVFNREGENPELSLGQSWHMSIWT